MVQVVLVFMFSPDLLFPAFDQFRNLLVLAAYLRFE